MKNNSNLQVKIRLDPSPCDMFRQPQWLHVEWFKIGGCKPRKYVDQYWLSENECEATPVELHRARALANNARELAAFDGLVDMKVSYMVKSGRRWIKTSYKNALAAEKAMNRKHENPAGC